MIEAIWLKVNKEIIYGLSFKLSFFISAKKPKVYFCDTSLRKTLIIIFVFIYIKKVPWEYKWQNLKYHNNFSTTPVWDGSLRMEVFWFQDPIKNQKTFQVFKFLKIIVEYKL